MKKIAIITSSILLGSLISTNVMATTLVNVTVYCISTNKYAANCPSYIYIDNTQLYIAQYSGWYPSNSPAAPQGSFTASLQDNQVAITLGHVYIYNGPNAWISCNGSLPSTNNIITYDTSSQSCQVS